MRITHKIWQIGLSLTCLAVTATAHADWAVNLGLISITPDSKTTELSLPGTGITIDSDTQFGGSFVYHPEGGEYFIEIGFSLPFEHQFDGALGLAGMPVGSTEVLPAMVMFQYPLAEPSAFIRPFVGVGVNYNIFKDETPSDALKGILMSQDVELTLSDGLGSVFQVGADVQFESAWGLHFIAAQIYSSTTAEVTVSGVTAATANIDLDPLLFTAAVSYRF